MGTAIHVLLIPAALLLPYLLYAIRGGMPGQLPGYLAILFPLLVATSALLRTRRIAEALDRRAGFLLALGCISLGAAGLVTGWAWDPGARSPETVNFYEEFLSTMRGEFFTHPAENRTEFAIHFSPILLLIYPLFTVVPFPVTLYAISALALTSAVPVAYLLFRSRWGRKEAALLAFGAALYPSILALYAGFSPVRFAPLVVWWLLLSYRRRDARQFCLAFGAALLVKETLCLALIMLTALAWAERRSWRWRLLPGGAAIASFLVITQYLLPLFADTPEKTSTIAAQFGYWGATSTAVLTGFLRDPVSVISALFRLNNLAYLLKLGHPVLFILPLGSPLVLLALPEALVNMMAGYNPIYLEGNLIGPWTSLLGHYSATIGAVVWAAAAESFAVKEGGSDEQSWWRARLLFLALLSSLIYPTNAESL